MTPRDDWRRLGAAQRAILLWLYENQNAGGKLRWPTPTEIGMGAGGRPCEKASSWASGKCIALCERGLIERNTNYRRSRYRLSDAGVDCVELNREGGDASA